MLQEIIKLIPGYPQKFGYSFSNEVFLDGLKFKFTEEYPWKSRRERNGFFEKLYIHKSADSYHKIIEWKTALHQEQAHIRYSWGLLLRFLSLLMIISCLVFFFLHHPLLSDILLGNGIVLLLIGVWLSLMASKARQSWVVVMELLKTLIEQKGKHMEAA